MKDQIIRFARKDFESSKAKRYTTLLMTSGALLISPALGWAANQAPTAVATVSASSGAAPFTTNFDASKSSDPDGSIKAYSWKFGDGTSSTASRPSHTYTSPGTYKASLKVTDNLGASRTTSLTITVTPPPPPVAADIPKGVYALFTAGTKVPDRLLTNPDITSIILRDVWGRVEIQEGVYDWSYFDAQLQRLASANKKATLVINSGGQATPDWVMSLGVGKFSFVNQNSYQDNYGEKITIPVFWDAVFLQKKLAFIQAVGLRYSSNPDLVMVDAQCANAMTADWNVPSTSTDVTAWKAAGFTSDKLLQACKQIVDATMAAFPRQAVKMAVGRLSSSLDTYSDSDYVARSLVAYANQKYPGRFIPERDNLSANTPDPATSTDNLGGWQVLYDNRPNIGGQMLWLASDESSCRMNGSVKPCDARTMLSKAVNTGIHYGMQFLEIYLGDIDNPELTSVIHDAAVALGAQ